MPVGAIVAAAAPAVIGGIASAVGGSGASSAINGGASAANALAQQATAQAQGNYQADQANVAPYIANGQNALAQYANITGVNGQAAANSAMSNFQSSPGYGYQVQQGLRAVDAGAASQGILNSGATIKAEQTLGSNLANQNFSNYLGQLNTLASGGLQGASLGNQQTQTFDNVLSGQSTNQQGTLTSAAGVNAGLAQNQANTLGNLGQAAFNTANTNGLFGFGSSNAGVNGTSYGSSGFNTNPSQQSAGASSLQSLGLYNPL